MSRRFGSFSTVFYPAISVLILIGMGILFYAGLVQDVSPFESQRLIKTDVQANGPLSYLITTREFCFSKDNEAEAGRMFRKVPDPNATEEVVETIPTRIHLLGGCHIRTRRVDVPETLSAGLWSYQTYLRWCNQLNNCRTVWLPPVLIRVEAASGSPRVTLAPEGS